MTQTTTYRNYERPEMSPTNNTCDWSQYHVSYLEQYGIDANGNPIPGFTLLPEDQILNKALVDIVNDSPELQQRLGQAEDMLDCCAGGVFRTALLAAPFANPEGSRIEFADLEGPALDLTQSGLNNGLRGWDVHLQHVMSVDKTGHWNNALDVIRKCGVAVGRSIFQLPSKKYNLTTTAFGPESLTGEVEEWRLAVLSLVNATKLGGVFIMHYMDGSNGWRGFPAVSIGKEEVEKVLDGKVQIIGHKFTPASGKARKETDPTYYRGMGMVIGLVT